MLRRVFLVVVPVAEQVLPDPAEGFEGSILVASGRVVPIGAVGILQGMVRVGVVLLVLFIEGFKPVLARVVCHGVPGKGGMHVVIPDVRVGRRDGVKELFIVVHFGFAGGIVVFHGHPAGLQDPGIAAVLAVVDPVGFVGVGVLAVIAVKGVVDPYRHAGEVAALTVRRFP